MPSEIRTLDALELWSRPTAGELSRSLRFAIVIASAITIVITAVTARLVWDLDGWETGLNRHWVRNGLAVSLAIGLAVTFVPPGRVSRFARIAVLLLVAHLTALVVAWWFLAKQLPRLERLTDVVPTFEMIPILAAVLLFGFGCFAVALLAARRRRGETLHALVMMTLVHLLVLGAWLPIAARLWGRVIWIPNSSSWTHQPDVSWTLIAFVLAPAFVVAAGFTMLAIRRPDAMRRRRGMWITLACALVVVAVLVSIGAKYDSLTIYGNFMHLVFAAVFLAVVALIVFGGVSWWRGRRLLRSRARERTWCAGTIVDDGDSTDVVGCIEITTWLRGPRSLLRPFLVSTSAGELEVPAGALLAAAMPLVTTTLRTGESAVVLRSGDRVLVGGFLDRNDGDHPFRESTTPLPGPNGLVVMPSSGERHGFTNVVLAMWRPSFAYLVIVMAVAAPGLIALLTAR